MASSLKRTTETPDYRSYILLYLDNLSSRSDHHYLRGVDPNFIQTLTIRSTNFSHFVGYLSIGTESQPSLSKIMSADKSFPT
jgi:hypothetical protein